MLVVYLLLLLLALGVLLGLRHCSAPGLLVPPKQVGHSQGDTIDVAMLYAPLNYYLYDDTLGGYSYDLLREISRTQGVVFNYVPVTSSEEAVKLLGNGAVDMIASLPVSAHMPGGLLLTDSVYTDHLVVVYNLKEGEEPVESPFRLAGQKIDLPAGSAALVRLRNLRDEIGDTIFLEQHNDLSDELLAMKVANGDYDFGVVNSRVAERLRKDYPHLASMAVGFTQLQSWAVADSALLLRINNLLKQTRDSEATGNLRRRYQLK